MIVCVAISTGATTTTISGFAVTTSAIETTGYYVLHSHRQQHSSSSPVISTVCLTTTRSSSVYVSMSKNSNYEPLRDKNNDNDADLAQYFQKSYVPLVSSLSSDKVTSMMPPSSLSSSSKSSSSFKSLSPLSPLRQGIFTNPIIPFLYERLLPPLWNAGLRDGGPQVEYDNAMSYLIPAKNRNQKNQQQQQEEENKKIVALDLSCGTGFVARRMASSSSSYFKHVFALDYSKEMLTECISTIQKRERNSVFSNLYIIQGDATSLPFQDNSIDVIHWGAAMHCVPDAEKALKEVYRVLKPNGGGRVYITTFLRPFPDVIFRFFTVEELKKMAKNAGFGYYSAGGPEKTAAKGDDGDDDCRSELLQVEGRGVYGVIRATK